MRRLERVLTAPCVREFLTAPRRARELEAKLETANQEHALLEGKHIESLKMLDKCELELVTANADLEKAVAEISRSHSLIADYVWVITPPAPIHPMIDTDAATVEALVRGILPNCLYYYPDTRGKIPAFDDLPPFVYWAGVWRLKWEEEGCDCDAFTRALKGKFVARDWVWIPVFDIWHDRLPGPLEDWHSAVLTLAYRVVDGETKIEVWLIEPQRFDLIQAADVFFDQLGVSGVLVKQ